MKITRWGKRRITKDEREEILRVYLEDVSAGVALAMSYGLSQIYAYKLAHERGLLPLTRYIPTARAAGASPS